MLAIWPRACFYLFVVDDAVWDWGPLLEVLEGLSATYKKIHALPPVLSLQPPGQNFHFFAFVSGLDWAILRGYSRLCSWEYPPGSAQRTIWYAGE